MNLYITRVELLRATATDYEVLTKAMLAAGFRTRMPGRQGREYCLPTGEYFADTPDDLRAVYWEARQAARNTGKPFYVLVNKVSKFMCDLKEVKKMDEDGF